MLAVLSMCGCSRQPKASAELLVVVTDVSAEELLCSCSPEAHRRYEALRTAMSQGLHRPVRFEYMTDFTFDSVPDEQAQQLRRADLMIGKCTAMEYVSTNLGIPSTCVALLTRTNGSPDFAGVWVAKSQSGIRTIGDLAGKRICIGQPWHGEKHDDALGQLRAANAKPGKVMERLLCKEAIADVAAGEADGAVISDYAATLLTNRVVTGGVSLREIGRTPPRPYIGVFATDHLIGNEREAVACFLMETMRLDSGVLAALRSKGGFIPPSRNTGIVEKDPLPKRL